MNILAIDPANVESAYTLVNSDTLEIYSKGKIPNKDMLNLAESVEYDCMAIEIIVNMGLSGKHLFETAEMIGKLCYICESRGIKLIRVKRTDVKKHFKVKRVINGQKAPSADSQIRTSLINKYGDVGTKDNQGYFYGYKADIWQAHAVFDYVLENVI